LASLILTDLPRYSDRGSLGVALDRPACDDVDRPRAAAGGRLIVVRSCKADCGNAFTSRGTKKRRIPAGRANRHQSQPRELGQLVTMSRNTVNAILRDFVRQPCIEIQYRSIVVTDREKLASFLSR
jgi:hypothetical protein